MILRSSLRDVQGLQDSSSGLMMCSSRFTEDFYEDDGVSGQKPTIFTISTIGSVLFQYDAEEVAI
jgi:hypothetical protein